MEMRCIVALELENMRHTDAYVIRQFQVTKGVISEYTKVA